jgi:Zn-dependent protease with chaperone function
MADQVRKILAGIPATAWEHPADRAALSVVRQFSALTEISNALIGNTQERQMRLWHLGSAIRVGSNQQPQLYHLLQEACAVLDMERVPDLFIMQNPILNAGALGVKNPFIVLTSYSVEGLSSAEMFALLGHELGHIKSGHAPYKTLLALVRLLISLVTASLPIPALAMQGIMLALLEWDRKSELTADRAALLACQNLDDAQGLLLKTAGGSLKGIDAEAFAAQADEYENSTDILDSLYKILQQAGLSHPLTAVRIRELRRWNKTGNYSDILNGTWKADEKEDIGKNFDDAYRQFHKDAEDTKDPLVKILSGLGKTAEEAGKNAQTMLNDFFKNFSSNQH